MLKVWKCRGLMLVLLAFSGNALAAAQPSSRIVGGSVVPDDRYPFMVSVYFDLNGDGRYNPGCGGTLIGSRWVLTAAHCMQDKDSDTLRTADEIAVLAGVLDLSDRGTGVLVKAQSIQRHPEYSRSTLVSDLALIELSEDVDSQVISLPSAESDVPENDEPAVVAGWGLTQEGGEGSNVLREVAVPIVSHARCLPYFPDKLRADANICAGGVIGGGSDACQGDSGGPLFVARGELWVQAGIVSYGEGCARPRVPGVYTRISSYTDWVASYVPDLQIFNSDSGSSDNGQSLDLSQLIQLTETSPTRTGSLLRGQVVIYEVSGAKRVDLTSTAGDADLYVFSGTRFEFEDVVCISEKTSLPDSCDLPETPERLFASVYSYLDSAYEIRIVFDQGVIEEPTPEIVEDPPVDTPVDMPAGPTVGPSVVEPAVQLPADDDPAGDITTADVDPGETEDVDKNVLGIGRVGSLSFVLMMCTAFTRRRLSDSD